MAWTSPRTWVTGEVLTAALLNTHLRDNLLVVGTPSQETATASAGFVSGTVARKMGRVVTVHIGLDSVAANAAGASAATLSASFRPPAATWFWGADTATGAAVLLSISTAGVIAHSAARSSGQSTLGVVSYLVD